MNAVPSPEEAVEITVEAVEVVAVEVEVEAGGAGISEESDGDEDLLVLESVDEPWELPVWEPTGQARVDEALDGLTRIDLDDVHTHADAYAEIHRHLRDTLSDLDASS